ncbi:MAG: hypothetical protein RRA94_06810 [Bacteroidota bacterium]|nr:hypothetical protein [Bacteroidota bacterium]
MSSHLDIIGSVIIAGMIILNFTVFMGERQESQIDSVNTITAQTEMSDVTSTLRHDLRKVGYGCDSLPILRATSSAFVFRADLDNDGKIDTVGYAFATDDSELSTTTTAGATTTTSTTESTTSKTLLYRVVNGRKQPGWDFGLVAFGFKYFRTDTYGRLFETTTTADVKAVAVTLRLRSKMKEDNEYQYSVNEFTVSPKNL